MHYHEEQEGHEEGLQDQPLALFFHVLAQVERFEMVN